MYFVEHSGNRQETNTTVTLSMGTSIDDQCVRNDMLITMIMTGELADDQIQKMDQHSIAEECSKDTNNPMYQMQGEVPFTKNCLRADIQRSTLRKYTINVTYKNVIIQSYNKLIRY